MKSNIIFRIRKKLTNNLIFLKFQLDLIVQLLTKKEKTIFLFGCPIHPNLGDHAQTYCILKWFNINYPDYDVIEFNWKTSTSFIFKLIKKKIKSHDLIFGHSGYFFFEPHRELPIFRKIAKWFPNQKFVILPQTINLTDEKIQAITVEALDVHPDLTLICRDEISFKKANDQFENCKTLLYPDIVTSLIGKYYFKNERNGILFCMRNDVEAYYSSGDISSLMHRLASHKKIDLTDTETDLSYWKIKNNRSTILKDTFTKFSRYKLIITDRYHGTIFSLIANTPVIVLSSADHKLSSGVRWFPKEFNNYVNYVRGLDEAYNVALKILDDTPNKKLPPYFDEKYFSKLKEDIESA